MTSWLEPDPGASVWFAFQRCPGCDCTMTTDGRRSWCGNGCALPAGLEPMGHSQPDRGEDE